jgi:ArsR family transcriptional regulator
MANISPLDLSVDAVSRLLALIGQPARVQILMVIGAQEACVCHLEAVLGMRQASISQHLMALRKANLVTTSREGRNIFYRLAQPEVMAILQQAAAAAGIQPDAMRKLARRPVDGCPCPQCNPEMDPAQTCGKLEQRTK